MDRLTDRQTERDGRLDRLTDRQTEKERGTDRKTDRQTDRKTEIETVIHKKRRLTDTWRKRER